MSEALLYQYFQAFQTQPGGFGREHPSRYKQVTEALQGYALAGNHVPDVDFCEYCGYRLNINQGWLVEFKPNATGIENMGAPIVIGGHCLDMILGELPVAPNYGTVKPARAKKIMSQRAVAIQALSVFREKYKSNSSIYAASNQGHWDSLLSLLKRGAAVSDVCGALKTWEMRDMYGWQNRIPLNTLVPLPFAFGLATAAVQTVVQRAMKYPEIGIPVPLLLALFGMNERGKRVNQPDKIAFLEMGQLAYGNEARRALKGMGL